MPIEYGVTFVKSDGARLGWDMFADTTGLPQLFRGYVAQYFEVDDDALSELLFDNVETTFPLPTQEPWLTADGVKFCYTAYEIAPYAAGQPSGTIPAEKVDKLLTPDARQMLHAK